MNDPVEPAVPLADAPLAAVAPPRVEAAPPPPPPASPAARDIRAGWILAAVATLLFFLTWGITVRAAWNDSADPCGYMQSATYKDALTKAEAAAKPAADMASGSIAVIDYYPQETGIGRPVCLALRRADKAPNLSVKELHLYLNGFELKKAVGQVVDPGQQFVAFDLSRSEGDSAVWNKIIGQPGLGIRQAEIGAGFAGEGPFSHSEYPPLGIRLYDLRALGIGLLAFLAAVVSLACFARQSGILRDGAAGSPYSLGRLQMAIWLYLITAGFLYIWLVTGEYNGIITPQALTLLGISATTGLSAVVMTGVSTEKSAGIVNDLLNDGTGISLHRVQILIWTGILAVIFLTEIYFSFQLPRFDENLLILMGISGATYLGFKQQEGK